MSTISYPSDPVVNGATEIQATTFNAVAADYVRVDYSAVQQFVARNGKMDSMPVFKNGIASAEWQFYQRKDLTGASALHRNLIGVRVVGKTQNTKGFVSSLAKVVDFTVGGHRVEIYNWYPAVITLTSGTTMVVWQCAMAARNLVVDPEDGSLLDGDGNHRAATEADGFLNLKVAANVPTNGPVTNALSGMYPLG